MGKRFVIGVSFCDGSGDRESPTPVATAAAPASAYERPCRRLKPCRFGPSICLDMWPLRLVHK
ncbi:MAG: hypothetical protein AMXMBFR34_31720 [Myxococcaceae bacterium]